jgi:hypothetical protein
MGASSLVEVVDMPTFVVPDFGSHDLEIRCTDGSVEIYGTRRGLSCLAELCLRLTNSRSGDTDHIHLEDYELLTKSSPPVAVAVFPSDLSG